MDINYHHGDYNIIFHYNDIKYIVVYYTKSIALEYVNI